MRLRPCGGDFSRTICLLGRHRRFSTSSLAKLELCSLFLEIYERTRTWHN